MRGKYRIKKYGGQEQKLKIKCLIASFLAVLGTYKVSLDVKAESCPDVRIVFARGSGGELNNDHNYLEFKDTIESKLKTTSLTYEFIDLDYPAIGIGADKLDVAIGAYVGAGEAYEFGDSVKSGVKKLDNMVNGGSCPNTRYVLGGYSQGAMVVSKALSSLDPDKLIYAATFGDPKIYLPEGKGPIPDACSGKNLSDYRVYVPDCHAYTGLLGAYKPYRPEQLAGKVGTWCNKNDIFCSSHLNINDHISYVADDLYNDASKIIFDKITKYYGIENQFYSPHDTAIVVDSTGSMASLIEKYKAEAFRLAKETLDNGGRVALYDYRDLGDPYRPVERCNFETCTIETFTRGLDEIITDGGGDELESLLSATFHVMEVLNWQHGATKSVVVLTDAGFLSPDRDGIAYADAVRLSKTIDPVNFYIITEPENEELYQGLAADTGGLVVTELDEFSLLTDYIMERYDSLPRVEESETNVELPTLSVTSAKTDGDKVIIDFTTDGTQVMVALNDSILGLTTENTITLSDLDFSQNNVVTLVPISGSVHGEAIEIIIDADIIIRAPNTGRL